MRYCTVLLPSKIVNIEVEKNHLGGISRYSAKYDFVGDVLKRAESHGSGGTEVALVTPDNYEPLIVGTYLRYWLSLGDSPVIVDPEGRYFQNGVVKSEYLIPIEYEPGLASIYTYYYIPEDCLDIVQNTIAASGPNAGYSIVTRFPGTGPHTAYLGDAAYYAETTTGVSDTKLTSFTYDHRGRLLSETATLNGASPAVVTYAYDELGKLSGKTYGSGADALTETYAYNIQGWLTSKTSPVFDMRLSYFDTLTDTPTDTPTDSLKPSTTPSYTRNITEWQWQHKPYAGNPGVDGATYTYAFTYDKLSRLTDSQQYTGTAIISTNTFVEKDLDYDKNGNIKTLKRYSGGNLVDNLSYEYSGNQLSSLTENIASPAAGWDLYERGMATTACYSYDSNGNMTLDERKGLQFTYNFLNLLGEARNSLTDGLVTKYSFLANGRKVSAVNGTGDFGLDYLGSLVYRRNAAGDLTLESTAFGGGRILASDTGTGYSYTPNYFITDHLGSTRAVVELSAGSTARVVERSDFYPFGARHINPSAAISDNRYRFSGKEDQDVFGLKFQDFGARMYDPLLGIWHSPDPLAEKYKPWSPHNYTLNNPINLIDLYGLFPGSPEGYDEYDYNPYDPIEIDDVEIVYKKPLLNEAPDVDVDHDEDYNPMEEVIHNAHREFGQGVLAVTTHIITLGGFTIPKELKFGASYLSLGESLGYFPSSATKYIKGASAIIAFTETNKLLNSNPSPREISDYIVMLISNARWPGAMFAILYDGVFVIYDNFPQFEMELREQVYNSIYNAYGY